MNYTGRVETSAKYVDASGCTALTELKAEAAKSVYARGCTALTELKAEAAEYVDARGCTALTELKAEAAQYVYARGCTALTELKVPRTAKVYRGPIRWFWHIHHQELVEMEAEPIEERIRYIRESKPAREIETRLRLLREVKDQQLLAKLIAADDAKGIAKLHAEECPDCPWNGETIFP